MINLKNRMTYFPTVAQKIHQWQPLNLKRISIAGGCIFGLLPQISLALTQKPPVTPTNIMVPANNTLFLATHAVGTQNYICLPTDKGVKFTLFTPQATLFNRQKQVISHYFSPDPIESGLIHATWQSLKSNSKIWGKVNDGNSSTDPAYVTQNAIPWLLITIVGKAGNSGDSGLSKTSYVQRVNTTGGTAPSTGCNSPMDIGNQAFVPYTADYLFYKQTK